MSLMGHNSFLRAPCIRLEQEQVARTVDPYFVAGPRWCQPGEHKESLAMYQRTDAIIRFEFTQARYAYDLAGERIPPFGCLDTDNTTESIDLRFSPPIHSLCGY